jgi:drug/metabolite transporter (DMT)-like permease
LRRQTNSLAAILIATTPIFSIVIGHYLTPDERITTNKLAGVALGIAGTKRTKRKIFEMSPVGRLC